MASKLRPNNSFKPKLLRSGNGVAEKACHAVTCATQFGLTQALGPQEQSQHAPGSAQTAVATCITQQPLRGQSEQSSPASNCKQLSLWHQGQGQDLQPANAGRAKSNRHTSDGLPDFVIQIGCQACALRSSEQEHRPNNSFKPSPLRGLGAT